MVREELAQPRAPFLLGSFGARGCDPKVDAFEVRVRSGVADEDDRLTVDEVVQRLVERRPFRGDDRFELFDERGAFVGPLERAQDRVF